MVHMCQWIRDMNDWVAAMAFLTPFTMVLWQLPYTESDPPWSLEYIQSRIQSVACTISVNMVNFISFIVHISHSVTQILTKYVFHVYYKLLLFCYINTRWYHYTFRQYVDMQSKLIQSHYLMWIYHWNISDIFINCSNLYFQPCTCKKKNFLYIVTKHCGPLSVKITGTLSSSNYKHNIFIHQSPNG